MFTTSHVFFYSDAEFFTTRAFQWVPFFHKPRDFSRPRIFHLAGLRLNTLDSSSSYQVKEVKEVLREEPGVIYPARKIQTTIET